MLLKREATYFKRGWENNKIGKDKERFFNCTSKKGSRQIRKEMRELSKYWGCYPFQYFRYNMYRQDCTQDLEDMKKYVPIFFSHHLLLPSIYQEYGVLCDDKLLFYQLLKSYGLRQAEFLFSFDQNGFYGNDNGNICVQEMLQILNNSNANRIFVKPVGGIGGAGIHVFEKKDSWFVNQSHEVFNEEYCKTKLKNEPYFVQEGVRQANEINVIYPRAINTQRIVTHFNSGKAQLLFSFMRMGYGGRMVDNVGEGGLVIKVDPETGELGKVAISPNFEEYTCHPDTQFRFEGYKIASWEQVKSFILDAAIKFRDIPYLGWDIAISESGPLIIEVNKDFSFNGIQIFYGGIRDIMNIGDPKKWWANSVRKMFL